MICTCEYLKKWPRYAPGVDVKKYLKHIFKVVGFAVQYSASFQGNCLRIAQNCVSGLFRCQNALWNAIKIGFSENNKRKFCPNLVCPINVQKFASLGWHIFMSFIQILVKLHTQYMQYLLDLLGIKSSGFLGIFVVWIKASERHDIGKKSPFRISVWIIISIWLSWFIQ